MPSRTVPARAAARSWAMTAATAASIRRGESFRSFTRRGARGFLGHKRLPTRRGGGRPPPPWGVGFPRARKALLGEELEAGGPGERVGGDLQDPPAPARLP